jgi:hypothetical protein
VICDCEMDCACEPRIAGGDSSELTSMSSLSMDPGREGWDGGALSSDGAVTDPPPKPPDKMTG